MVVLLLHVDTVRPCDVTTCGFVPQAASKKHVSKTSPLSRNILMSLFRLSGCLFPKTYCHERKKETKEAKSPRAHTYRHIQYIQWYTVYMYIIYIHIITYIYEYVCIYTYLSVRLCTTVLVCMHALLSDWRQAADVICCSAAISACEMLGLEFVYLVNWTYTESHVITFRTFSRSFIYFLVPVYHI